MVGIINAVPIRGSTKVSPKTQIAFTLTGLKGSDGDAGKLKKSSFSIDILEKGKTTRAVSKGAATDDYKVLYDVNNDDSVDIKLTRSNKYKEGETIRVTASGDDNNENSFRFASNFTITKEGVLGAAGSVWWSLTAADLLPFLDPDNEGSLADRAQDFIEEGTDIINKETKKITNITNQISSLSRKVASTARELDALQKEIEELMNNTLNTGLYTRVVGLDFKINNNNEFMNRVQQVMFDFSDQNRPDFRGDTAFIGGLVLIVGGPNPLVLKEQLLKMTTLFPFLRNLIGELSTDKKDEVQDLDFKSNKALLELESVKVSEDYISATTFEPPDVEENKKLFDENGSHSAPKNFFEKTTEKIPDSWMAMRVSQLFDGTFLDPDDPNSTLSKILKTEKDAANKIIGIVKQADDLANTINNITNDINNANREIQTLGQMTNEFIDNVASTGIFAHLIGNDLSLQNNSDFVRGVRDAINDVTDPNRPEFKGDSAIVAGVIMVVGAPDVMGLEDEINKLGSVFKGIKDSPIGSKTVQERVGNVLGPVIPKWF